MINIHQLLLEKLNLRRSKVEEFFFEKFLTYKPLIYNSVDLRHSGFKIAPVDTNCFPAGFNNLDAEAIAFSQNLFSDFIKKRFPPNEKVTKKILLLPENHTRNLKYLENISVLSRILSGQDHEFEVRIGSLIEDLSDEIVIENVRLEPVIKNKDNLILADGFTPDIAILNNDLSDGIPQILEELNLPIIPAPKLGWYSRTKSNHFSIYNQLAVELSTILDIDPWLISTIHNMCDNLNFKEHIGFELLAQEVEKVLAQIRKKYQEYNLKEQPYCYVKADSGTYGIGVMSVSSGEEILHLNKKDRNKMNMSKGLVQNHRVMIQEGVPTCDYVNEKPAEPLIYMIQSQIAANLLRINEFRDEKTSLNAAGAIFADLKNLSDQEIVLGASKTEVVQIYQIIARLAALAAAIEGEAIF